MDDVIEIDLRKIIKDLLASWKWIVGFTLLVGLAAAAFSLLQPRTYSTSALIAITKPRYLPNFDEQYQTINNNPPTGNTIIDLATSDEIVRALYELWQSPDKADTTPREFLEQNLQAKAGGDPSIVVLKVVADTPEEAAKLANAWAQSTASRANELFSGTDGSHVADFLAQVDEAEQNLAEAEAALTDFESRNQVSMLNNQLASLLADQADALRKQRLIQTTIDDANGLAAQMETQTDGSAVPSSLQTNFLVLQMRIYNDSNAASSTINTNQANQAAAGASALQIQIPNQVSGSPVTLPDQTVAQTITKSAFVSRIEAWTSTLEAQSAELGASQSRLSAQVTGLQQQIQEQNSEKGRLTVVYKNAQDVYATLRLKLEEVKITSSELYGNVQVASGAAAPVKPDSRLIGLYFGGGLLTGLILSFVFMILKNWWLAPNPN
jgi:succinoglycan biosynthesis transport protein ExoP